MTRAIAERLAAVSRALEEHKYDAEEVAMFLMRCLFTMFAEDVGLLPKASFRNLLERCEQDPSRLGHMVGQLWEAMDTGDFAYALETKVRRFNGVFFKTRTVLPLGREEIGELRRAASYDWRDVDPSIFGTLLEQALDPKERRRLGAHYTPRAYVERLVVATVIEPLRADWDQVQASAERQKGEGRAADAAATVLSFHEKLCRTRILDPACGTGNFLYVSLELLKRLEGEVLEALVDLGGQEALRGLEGHTVDPHQFRGLEINPRAGQSQNWCYGSGIYNGISASRAACRGNRYCGTSITSRAISTRSCRQISAWHVTRMVCRYPDVRPMATCRKYTNMRTRVSRTGRKRSLLSAILLSSEGRTSALVSATNTPRRYGRHIPR